MALDHLLDEDSTFYGDLFPHAVQWQGEVYLEDGLHRALRAALENRHTIHVRILDLDALRPDGQLLAVHWRHPAPDHPRTGDQVHELLAGHAGLSRLARYQDPDFTAEVYARSDGDLRSVAQAGGIV